MIHGEIDETGRQFMIRLYEQTRGDQSVQVSMYDIGGQMGLEREAAARVAEELIGSQLVQIITLSGGIGISAAGSEMAQALIGPLAADSGGSIRLVDEPLLNPVSRQAVAQIITEIKGQTGTLGLDFDTLTEVMADLKTLDAQLESSRPKTAIIRACLQSICEAVKGCPNSGIAGRISAMVGN
jgi:hypothetical protein